MNVKLGPLGHTSIGHEKASRKIYLEYIAILDEDLPIMVNRIHPIRQGNAFVGQPPILPAMY